MPGCGANPGVAIISIIAYPPRWICGLRLSSLYYGMRFLAGMELVVRDGLGEVGRHCLGQLSPVAIRRD